jgi:hypothetical protein
MELTIDKIEEICQEVIKTLTKEVKVDVFYQPLDGSAPSFEGKYNFNRDDANLSLIGIFDDDIHDCPLKVTGYGIYSLPSVPFTVIFPVPGVRITLATELFLLPVPINILFSFFFAITILSLP